MFHRILCALGLHRLRPYDRAGGWLICPHCRHIFQSHPAKRGRDHA